MEYYSGILILTTNRVGEFDEAFKSRIHISLYYPKLDRNSTMKIWEMNLSRLERSDLNIDVNRENILGFAKDRWKSDKQRPSRRWNGRQIKNAFQTAVALATWDHQNEDNWKKPQRPILTDKHFSIVALTSAHFDEYLSATHGIDEDETYSVLAQRAELRSDNVPKINWGDRADRRSERKSSEAYSNSSRRRNDRHYCSRDRRSDEDEDEDDSSGSRMSNDQTGKSDEDDLQIRELKQELQRRQQQQRRKSSTKSNGNENTRKESMSRLVPETRPRREMAMTEEDSEEKSDDD